MDNQEALSASPEEPGKPPEEAGKPPEEPGKRPPRITASVPMRRQTRSTRRLEPLRPPPRNWFKLVGIMLGTVFGLGLFAFGLQQYVKARSGKAASNKASLYVSQVVGSPERTNADGAKASLSIRDELKGGFHLDQSDGDRTTLTTGWGGRIVIAKKASVDFSAVQLQPNRPQASRLQIKGREGAIMIDVSEGDPLFEIELPQGNLVYGGTGRYWISMDLIQSSIIVRDGLVRVRSGATARTVRVTSEQRLLIDARGEWKEPAYFPTGERVWQ
jgi:hypothetical protein